VCDLAALLPLRISGQTRAAAVGVTQAAGKCHSSVALGSQEVHSTVVTGTKFPISLCNGHVAPQGIEQIPSSHRHVGVTAITHLCSPAYAAALPHSTRTPSLGSMHVHLLQQSLEFHGPIHKHSGSGSCLQRSVADSLSTIPSSSQQVLNSHVASTAAYSSLFGSGVRSARALLGIDQAPPASPAAAPRSSSSNADQLTLPTDSADLQPNLNPSVLNATRPPPAPAPAATSAAASEAAAGANWTGPSVKPVGEVRAGDSCVCWNPSTCTCGWQSCPYKPPEQAAALPSDSARELFGQDVLPQLQLSNDTQGAREAPPLT
jgi:hypothetical protein